MTAVKIFSFVGFKKSNCNRRSVFVPYELSELHWLGGCWQLPPSEAPFQAECSPELAWKVSQALDYNNSVKICS